MYITKTVAAIVATLLLAGSAQAQIGVTADIGTTGVGAHLVIPMEKTLNGRFGANYFTRTYDETANTVNYKMKAKLQTFDILFDWYLIDASKVRVTGGVVYNGNKVTGVAKPNANGFYSINGNTYTAADVANLTGKVYFRKAAPYLGVGWGNALAMDSRLNFTAELGAFFQGKPKSHLVSLGCVNTNSICAGIAKDVNAERLKFQNDIDAYKAYPVLRVSAAYRF